jgi:hypothetical protein
MSRHTQLEIFLGSMYRADVMKEGNFQTARDALVKLLSASQELLAQAEERLKEAQQVVAKKKLSAHIEIKVVRYLEEVLPMVKERKKEKVHG